jgi:hypothetical protein
LFPAALPLEYLVATARAPPTITTLSIVVANNYCGLPLMDRQ